MQNLIIAGREFSSRLFLGTGKFRSNQEMQQAIEASGTEMVTLAMKRVEMGDANDDMLAHIPHQSLQLLPNTTIAAMRMAQGSASPLDIMPAVLITSFSSLFVAVLSAKLLSRFSKRRYG